MDHILVYLRTWTSNPFFIFLSFFSPLFFLRNPHIKIFFQANHIISQSEKHSSTFTQNSAENWRKKNLTTLVREGVNYLKYPVLKMYFLIGKQTELKRKLDRRMDLVGGARRKSSYLCRRGGAIWFPCWAYPVTVRSLRQSVYHVSLRDVYRGGAECSTLDSAFRTIRIYPRAFMVHANDITN